MARDPWAVMNGSSRLVDAEDARHAIAALFTPGSSPVDALQGLRPGAGDPGKVAATGTPGINVTVNSFQGLLTATRGAGGYIITEPAQLTVPILNVPADGSNQRNDLILYRQYDTYYSDGATQSGVIRVQGTPSGTPADPSLAAYPDYMLLARVRVTAGATTVTNAMIDDLRPPWVVGVGGVMPIRNLTERATLSHWAGRSIYRIDKGWEEFSDGTAWRIRGFVTVAALADVTDPYAGQLVHLSTDNMAYRWSGSAWVGAFATGGTTAATRHGAKYRQTGTAQTTATGTQQRINFTVTDYDTNDWTTSVVTGGTVFTCARDGNWGVTLNSRYSGAAAAERAFTLAASGAPMGTVYGTTSAYTGGTAPYSGCVHIEQDFSVGDTVCAFAYQAAAATLALDLTSSPTSIVFRYLGPKGA